MRSDLTASTSKSFKFQPSIVRIFQSSLELSSFKQSRISRRAVSSLPFYFFRSFRTNWTISMFARSSFLFGYLWHVINTLKMGTTMVRIRDNRYSLSHFASVSLVVERSRCFKVTGRCHRKKEEKKFATKRKEKKETKKQRILQPDWPWSQSFFLFLSSSHLVGLRKISRGRPWTDHFVKAELHLLR